MPAQTENLRSTLAQLSQNQMEAIWLGAILTAHLANDKNAEAVGRIITTLEDIQASTIGGTVIVIDLIAGDESATSQALAHRLDIHALRQALIHEL